MCFAMHLRRMAGGDPGGHNVVGADQGYPKVASRANVELGLPEHGSPPLQPYLRGPRTDDEF